MLDAFLEALIARGVSLWADGVRLMADGPPGSIRDADREMLRDHKTEIMAILASGVPLQAIEDDDAETPAWIDDDSLTVTLGALRASISFDRSTQATQIPQVPSTRVKSSRDHYQQPLPGRKTA